MTFRFWCCRALVCGCSCLTKFNLVSQLEFYSLRAGNPHVKALTPHWTVISVSLNSSCPNMSLCRLGGWGLRSCFWFRVASMWDRGPPDTLSLNHPFFDIWSSRLLFISDSFHRITSNCRSVTLSWKATWARFRIEFPNQYAYVAYLPWNLDQLLLTQNPSKFCLIPFS